MKPLEVAIIRYIENNHYQVTMRQLVKTFEMSSQEIKKLLAEKNIKLIDNKLINGIKEDLEKM